MLVVVALIEVLVLGFTRHQHVEQIRERSVGLVRLLARVPAERLLAGDRRGRSRRSGTASWAPSSRTQP